MSGIFYQDHPGTAAADAPVLVLLHGWGMQSGVWETFLPWLAPHVRVRCIDLPGSGRSAAVPMPASLEALAELLLAVAPARAAWLGWSLGGLLALEMAVRFPQRVSHLLLMAATPCFVQREDWPSAMPAPEFRRFAESLRQDAAQTLKRFLALQCLGSVSAKQDLRVLQSSMTQAPTAAGESLQQGLALLGDSDRRARFAALAVPVLCLLGEQDALVPASLAADLSSLLPAVQVRVVPGAAHLPFLSNAPACREAVLDLLGSTS